MKRPRPRRRFREVPLIIEKFKKGGGEVRDPLCFEFFQVVIHRDVLTRMDFRKFASFCFLLMSLSCLRSCDDLYIRFI